MAIEVHIAAPGFLDCDGIEKEMHINSNKLHGSKISFDCAVKACDFICFITDGSVSVFFKDTTFDMQTRLSAAFIWVLENMVKTWQPYLKDGPEP